MSDSVGASSADVDEEEGLEIGDGAAVELVSPPSLRVAADFRKEDTGCAQAAGGRRKSWDWTVLCANEVILAAAANLGISYNVVVISLSLEVMEGLYPSTARQQGLAAGAFIAGMMIGQLLFGGLGDCMGRLRALALTLLVCTTGALGSAVLTRAGPELFSALAGWRFLLGIGAGGVYPLAATLAREGAANAAAANAAAAAAAAAGSAGNAGTKEADSRDGSAGAGNLPANEFLIANSNANTNTRSGVILNVNGATQPSGEGASEAAAAVAVAVVFSMQGVGYLLASLLQWVLISSLGNSEITWRLALGFGALPPLAVALATRSGVLKPPESGLVHKHKVSEDDLAGGKPLQGASTDERSVSDVTDVEFPIRERRELPVKAEAAKRPSARELFRQFGLALADADLARALIGTAGSWALFDVTFYGNTLFQPQVLKDVFGPTEKNTASIAAQNTALAAVALPAYLLAPFLIGRIGPKRMQVGGFMAVAALYVIIGTFHTHLQEYSPLGALALYAMSFFCANLGPNTTTFILPSLVFPMALRGSMNGLSAACGKLGALIGALAFAPLASSWGLAPVMIICGAISTLGGLLTLAMVPGRSAANGAEKEAAGRGTKCGNSERNGEISRGSAAAEQNEEDCAPAGAVPPRAAGLRSVGERFGIRSYAPLQEVELSQLTSSKQPYPSSNGRGNGIGGGGGSGVEGDHSKSVVL